MTRSKEKYHGIVTFTETNAGETLRINFSHPEYSSVTVDLPQDELGTFYVALWDASSGAAQVEYRLSAAEGTLDFYEAWDLSDSTERFDWTHQTNLPEGPKSTYVSMSLENGRKILAYLYGSFCGLVSREKSEALSRRLFHVRASLLLATSRGAGMLRDIRCELGTNAVRLASLVVGEPGRPKHHWMKRTFENVSSVDPFRLWGDLTLFGNSHRDVAFSLIQLWGPILAADSFRRNVPVAFGTDACEPAVILVLILFEIETEIGWWLP